MDVPDDPMARFWEQVAILRRFHDVAVADPEDGSLTPAYLAEQGHLLVREGAGNLDLVTQNVTVRSGASPSGIKGLLKVPIVEDVREAIKQVRRAEQQLRGAPRVVTPNHYLVIAPVNACPADEPLPVYPPDGVAPESLFMPPPAEGDAGLGVEVLVVDTGLLSDFAEVSAATGGDGTPPSITGNLNEPVITGDPRRPAPPGILYMYMGHGSFIERVLSAIAPRASVRVSNELLDAGAISEADLGTRIFAAIDKWRAGWQQRTGATDDTRWPDIISLSAGAPTEDDRPLQGLTDFLNALDQHPETTLVAAACNDGRTKPAWPAASGGPNGQAGIVSVGALREDWRGRACFSNYGDWVQVFVRGERLVNRLTRARYTTSHGPTRRCRFYRPDYLYPHCTCLTCHHHGKYENFTDLAQWSGTSFSTPVVAGRIAAAMNQPDGTRLTSREAWARLAREIRPLTDVDGVELPVLPEPYASAVSPA
jgi:hypothetical protein